MGRDKLPEARYPDFKEVKLLGSSQQQQQQPLAPTGPEAATHQSGRTKYSARSS